MHLIKEDRATFCGLKMGHFPENNVWIEDHLAAAYLADKSRTPCLICFPEGRPQFGTPLSKLSGRPGHEGFDEFCRISSSWGYD